LILNVPVEYQKRSSLDLAVAQREPVMFVGLPRKTGDSRTAGLSKARGDPIRLGILADIHEQTKQLRKAIAVLREHGAERFVVLGDVFETGKRMEETVGLLQEVGAVGVWGNHDIGLCFDPDDKVCEG
jgi:hypothetical protein